MSTPKLSQYDDIINAKAQQYGLPPALVRSVIWQESRGNPKAISPVGAQGLMQLMPATAKELGVKNPFDPVENIDGGVRYLKSRINKVGLVNGIAAYNAGLGNVQKYKGVPPFKETQNYVSNILKNFNAESENPVMSMASPVIGPSPRPFVQGLKDQINQPIQNLRRSLGISPDITQSTQPTQKDSVEGQLSQLYKQTSIPKTDLSSYFKSSDGQYDYGTLPSQTQLPLNKLNESQFKLNSYLNETPVSRSVFEAPSFIEGMANKAAGVTGDYLNQHPQVNNFLKEWLDPSLNGPLKDAIANTPIIPPSIARGLGQGVAAVPKAIVKPIAGVFGYGDQADQAFTGIGNALGNTISGFSTPKNIAIGTTLTTPFAPAILAGMTPGMIQGTYQSGKEGFNQAAQGNIGAAAESFTDAGINGLMSLMGVKGIYGGVKPLAKRYWDSLPEQPLQKNAYFGSGLGGLQEFFDKPQNNTPKSGQKERGFVTTVKESPNSPAPLAEGVQGNYTPITNKTTLELAQSIIQENPSKARDNLLKTTNPTAVDMATGMELMRKYNAEKDFSQSIQIAQHLAKQATQLGQSIQALSMYDKLGPEGLQKLAASTVEKARDALPEFKKKQLEKEVEKIKAASPDLTKDQIMEIAAKNLKTPYLTPEFAKQIYEKSSALENLPEGSKERAVATALILKDIASQVPSSFLRKVSTYQTLAQLSNPKTVIRNILGNAAFTIAENVKDVVANPLDRVVSLATGERTKSLSGFNQIGEQIKGFKEGFVNGAQDAWKGIDTSKVADKWEINRIDNGLPQAPTFRGKILGNVEKVVGVALKAPDRAFYQAAFNKSIAEQMALKKVSKPTSEMLAQANFEGLYKTFQDDSLAAQLFTGLKRTLNFNKEFGAGDVLLKYPKTPGNLLSRSLDYSPAGFVKGIFELGKAALNRGFDQKTFVDSTSRALVGGVGITGLGYGLSQLGLLRNTAARDPEQRLVESTAGLNQSQLNTTGLLRWITNGFDPKAAKLKEGDNLVTYDWAVPLSVSASMGARAQEKVREHATKEKSALDLFATGAAGLEGGLETLGQQPLIATFTKMFQGKTLPQALVESTKGIPASFTPTLLKQISQLFDNTKRDTKDANPANMAINLALNKTPFAGNLPAQIDPFGNKMENYQGGTNSFFNVLINPAFSTKYLPTPATKLAIDLYKETGDKSIVPNKIQEKFKIKGVSFEMTPDQRNRIQQVIGKTTEQFYTKLANNPEFMRSPNEVKIKIIQKFLNEMSAASRVLYFADKMNQKNQASKQ